MEYLYALLGFALLIGSGKYLVRGSVSIAQHFNISTLVIGVTVVAFGTSAPELLVSVQAALKGYPEMSVGNVVGSNISNIALVLAITAVILPIKVSRNSVIIDWPVMMGVSLLFYILSRNRWLGRTEGFIFMILLVAYVIFSLKLSRRQMNTNGDDTALSAAYCFRLSSIDHYSPVPAWLQDLTCWLKMQPLSLTTLGSANVLFQLRCLL